MPSHATAESWYEFAKSERRISLRVRVLERDLTEEKSILASLDYVVGTAERPLLLFLTGAPGAGKTTLYESKLRETFPVLLKSSPSPLEQSEVERQQKELLKTHKSFVFQSSVVDMDLLEKARSDGFDVKVIFIGTEHPDLNIARILSRVSRGGLFAPIATLQEEHEDGLRQLNALAKAADELVLLDNTAEGRSPRVIAQFAEGQIVRLARSTPEWADKAFGNEFSRFIGREKLRSRAR
jgi:predicted ABC-type ATPase